MGFELPDVVMPSPEELHASCLRKYEFAAETFLDNWPEDLRALSFPTTFVEVDAGKMRDLFGHPHEAAAVRDDLARQIDDAMGWSNWFVRLNTRSPKDATAPEMSITCSGKQAVWWFSGSERVLDDTSMLYHARKPLYVCLREYKHMFKDGEFRCFARDGRLRAVSRYFYNEPPMPGVRHDSSHIWDAAQAFYERHLTAGRYPDIVFDLYMPGGHNETLIEINPYGLSDPCLFTYPEIETVGGVRLAPEPTPTPLPAGTGEAEAKPTANEPNPQQQGGGHG